MKKVYKQTQAVYEKLAKKYVENIKDLTPDDLYRFIELLPSGASILEVGCAGGRDARIFLDKGFKVAGIDLVKAFIDIAREECPDGDFYQMDVLDLDFPDSKFDAVWAYASLLHLDDEDMLKALVNINKVLKSQGKIFLGLKLGDKESIVSDKLSDGEERYFNFTTKERVFEYLQESGFKVLKYFLVADKAGRDDVKWIYVFAEKS
ncbi:MAG: class I SAM-dependent methyltransferase [bacterium]|nr:class I SAM-dependent methyltransferase [bacterium]